MARSKRTRKPPAGKEIRPTYFVFCEGETEEQYVKALNNYFHTPIKVRTKLEGNKISRRKINNFLNKYDRISKDRVFLMYDLDSPSMLDKLQSIPDSTLLVSNPCIELWFCLHFKSINRNISSRECVKKIHSCLGSYKKGRLGMRELGDLIKQSHTAINKAKTLKPHNNPSTTVYKLLEELVNSNS